MLAASAACFIFSISSAGGSLQVWAEDYYGWNDGTRDQSPFFLYVTPKDNSTRSTEDKYVVYCFNRDKEWPEAWELGKTFEQVQSEQKFKLPLYQKLKGSSDVFKHNASKPRSVNNIERALVTVLMKGYPTVKNIQGLSEPSSRKVTQLAIWYFSDNRDNPDDYLQDSEKLTSEERAAFTSLVDEGKKSGAVYTSNNDFTLDIYTTTATNYTNKQYQNLLGSTLISKIPTSETEIHSNLIELNFEGIIENHSNTNSNLLEGSSQKHTLEETPRVPKIIMGQRGYTLPGKEGVSDTAIEFIKDTGGSEELLGSANAIETEDSKIPHIMGHGGKLAGEAGETQQAGQTGGHTPTIEITQDTQEGRSGSCASQTETEDTQKPTVIMGSQGQPIETSESTQGGMSGQSGNATETDDTKQPDVILSGQDQVINTEESLSGMSGQSGNATETDDTKQPDVILSGQGQVINTEERLSGMSGQSGNATETDDTKQPDVILGGQGQVINTEENLSGMSGQSGNITEIDDTKQPDVILSGQGHVIDISEHSSAGRSGSCDSLTTLEDAEHSTADSDTKQAGKERRLPQTSDQKHLPLSLLMPVILLLISLRAIFTYPFKDNN
ncbi:thioester-forming surface-anchored protein [Streptococcus halichoeri]|uniref:thioester-forming surface-anchored protein n=1 Tax=Streptococcus halichoeri TaxID=254785 RepID=UPI001F336B0D|nr:thioester-forming surface-anchored protein [Streptococcus halichoeri]